MSYQAGIGAKLGIRGTLECKDKDGNVLKVIELSGSIPLEKLDMTVEQAKQLIEEQDHGFSYRK